MNASACHSHLLGHGWISNFTISLVTLQLVIIEETKISFLSNKRPMLKTDFCKAEFVRHFVHHMTAK